jgi:glycosyltransferase involved in cell wall biosynthesis
MHVLFLPKWYPGRNDPQLGDFLRKQAIAVATRTQVSVVCALPLVGVGALDEQVVDQADGPWELRCYYRASTHPITAVRRLINLERYWRAMMRGWDRLLKERGMPDLLHVHIMVRPAVVARWINRRHRIPYLISEQSSEYLDNTFVRKGPRFRWYNQRLFKAASAITAVSKWLGDALVQHGLCSSYEVVPNVVPGLDRPLPPPGDPGHFMMVADLVDRTKNVSGVLRALAMAITQRPGIRLTVIGDGPDRDLLEALADDLDLRSQVTFLGRLPNAQVLEHMARTGAVIINSNVETFSVVTGEALAQGKPVIATRCGGPIAFVTPENGLLIPVGDEHALLQAMVQLHDDHSEYVPERIRGSVSERFGQAAVADGFRRIYQRILDGRS